jgi:hypothetical protein
MSNRKFARRALQKRMKETGNKTPLKRVWKSLQEKKSGKTNT